MTHLFVQIETGTLSRPGLRLGSHTHTGFSSHKKQPVDTITHHPHRCRLVIIPYEYLISPHPRAPSLWPSHQTSGINVPQTACCAALPPLLCDDLCPGQCTMTGIGDSGWAVSHWSVGRHEWRELCEVTA